MPRIFVPALKQLSPRPTRALNSARSFSYTPSAWKGSQNATPGWEGRHGDDHAVKRDGLDAQSSPSKQSREDKEKASNDPGHKEGGAGVHEQDDKNLNKKAKQDNPEAPEPVIGMNSERGGKGH